MKKNKEKKNLESVVSLTIGMLIGVTLIAFGIKDSLNLTENTKDYVSVEGTLCGYSEYSEGKVYSLEYEYIVNEKKYYIETDYAVGAIPEMGSLKTIKYNPHNPSEAIIGGSIIDIGGNILWIGLGFMFFFISLLLLMDGAKKNESKKKKRYKAFITSVLIGITFSGLGIIAYYMMCLGTNQFSLVTVLKSYGIFAIIPIVFIIFGIFTIVMSIFMPKKKEIILKVEEINDYGFLLADVSVDENSIKAWNNKYFVYNPENTEKFEIGKEFKVNIYKYGIIFAGIEISPKILARSLKPFVDSDFEDI